MKVKRKKSVFKWVFLILMCFIVAIGAYFGLKVVKKALVSTEGHEKQLSEKLKVTEMLLTPNDYSRPGDELPKVNGIVVHYVANPGSSAEANRNYFENLRLTQATSVSSHFIIGLDGEIIQCIPLDEIAYATKQRNKDTISIECCHPGEDGKFNQATYDSLVRLCAWLYEEYDLSEEDILRHYDVTGKDCPRYFVAHEKEWESFKKEVGRYETSN